MLAPFSEGKHTLQFSNSNLTQGTWDITVI
jgi:hypothetical protein